MTQGEYLRVNGVETGPHSRFGLHSFRSSFRASIAPTRMRLC
jgi:hypothetical protein